MSQTQDSLKKMCGHALKKYDCLTSTSIKTKGAVRLVGRNKLKYKKTMKEQINNELTKMLQNGEGKSKGKDTSGEIHSYETYKTYKKQCYQFEKYMRENHPKVTTMKKARAYVKEYIIHEEQRGLSAWTIHTKAKALNKLYDIKPGDAEYYECPKRERRDIIRSRLSTQTDLEFKDNDKYKDLIDFLKATGLRRSEVACLKGKNVVSKPKLEKYCNEHKEHIGRVVSDALKFNDVDYFVYVEKGKGGRNRLVPIIGPRAKEFAYLVFNKDSSEKVFGEVPKNLDVHGIRSEYATNIYKSYARPIEEIPHDVYHKGIQEKYQSGVYCCRKDARGKRLDRAAMKMTSKALGHNRIDVVANNYIR